MRNSIVNHVVQFENNFFFSFTLWKEGSFCYD